MMKQKSILVATALLMASLVTTGAYASNKTGAFIGGMVAGKVLHNMSERTEAQKVQAYNSQPRVVYSQAPAQSTAAPSAQQKLDELDKLAAGGYITKEEYQTRRKAILDTL
ncbi:SHOCT domain-containing protein [Motilimonas sp. KMU-193]|uniref:SHOCT domain-containing protein n=1 Tax=Motilimonas sp. KMU-193 TaxID=3388668 RepID=UPI00396B17EC